MNILQVHHNWDEAEPGGIVAMMNDLMDGLSARGHRVDLLVHDWQAVRPLDCTDRNGRPYRRFNLVPLPARTGDLKAWLGWLLRFPAALWRLRRLCRERCIDVAQLHYADALYLVFIVLRLFGGPHCLVTVHRGDLMGYADLSASRRWGLRRVLAGADAVVAVSRALAGQARSLVPGIRRLESIHNGFTPTSEALLTSDQLAQELGRGMPGRFAVLVGNCRQYKGQDIGLEAWAQLGDAARELPLLLVGGGPDLEAMRSLAAELGLDDGQVLFTGPLSRRAATSLTALAALQVAPSRNEGQGIVILEAGYYATPVICSDIPPFLEMVADGDTAAVFPAGDAAALAGCVRAFLAEADRARVMAQRLQERVRSDFGCDAMVANYLSLYDELLD